MMLAPDHDKICQGHRSHVRHSIKSGLPIVQHYSDLRETERDFKVQCWDCADARAEVVSLRVDLHSQTVQAVGDLYSQGDV